MRLAAAPVTLLARHAGASPGPAIDVPDALRYVATARATLKGPLVAEIDGPGDPLASAESVLRILALVHAHHPDVRTGLVIDGPLLAEYVEELTDFGLSYVILRTDAASQRAAARFVQGATYRGETLDRDAAATLYGDEILRAYDHARRVHLPVAARITLVPSWNGDEIEPLATRAAAGGAQRVDVVAPDPDALPRRALAPTPSELADARAAADTAFERERGTRPHLDVLQWLTEDRFRPVNIDQLEAVDFLRTLPDPEAPEPVLGRLLPPRRAQLVAVATRDGGLVDLPLVGATAVSVYAVTAQQIRLLGTRPLADSPRRRQDGVGDAQAFLSALVGCRALVATEFSTRARTLLHAVGNSTGCDRRRCSRSAGPGGPGDVGRCHGREFIARAQ